jgi:transcription antitermination factor NusG
MRHWYVLPVLGQHELRIETKIRDLKYDALAPWHEGQKHVRGNRRKWRRPLYVGYVFVSFPDHAAGWQHLNRELNTVERKVVFRLLGGDAPAILRPEDVGYLQSIADGRFKPEDAAPTVVIGDRVLVPDGLLKGQPSIVTEIISSKKRGKIATLTVIEGNYDMTQEFPLEMLVKA